MWADSIPIRVGDVLTAVGAGDTDILGALERRLAPLVDRSETAGTARPIAFGVRTVKVGWRRRRVSLVHQGVRARARFDTADAAIDHLDRLVRDLEQDPGDGLIRVNARVLTDGAHAVLLLASSAGTPPDERPLIDAGVVEPPVWRASVDPSEVTVRIGADRRVPLVALVVTDVMAGDSIDGSRRHLWAAAEGPALDGWTELLDTRPDLIERVDPEAMVTTVLGRLRR